MPINAALCKPEWDSVHVRVTQNRKADLVWATRVLRMNVNAWLSDIIDREGPKLIKRAETKRGEIRRVG